MPGLVPGAGDVPRNKQSLPRGTCFLVEVGEEDNKQVNKQLYDIMSQCNKCQKEKYHRGKRKRAMGRFYDRGELGKAWLRKRHLNRRQNGVKEQAM